MYIRIHALFRRLFYDRKATYPSMRCWHAWQSLRNAGRGALC